MAQFNGSGHHRGATFNYGEVVDTTRWLTEQDNGQVDGTILEITQKVIEIGEAIMVTYEQMPEMMSDYRNFEDMAGATTPVNTSRPTSVQIKEDSVVDNSDERVFFELVYKTFSDAS
jgi:hypothetical protein